MSSDTQDKAPILIQLKQDVICACLENKQTIKSTYKDIAVGDQLVKNPDLNLNLFEFDAQAHTSTYNSWFRNILLLHAEELSRLTSLTFMSSPFTHDN